MKKRILLISVLAVIAFLPKPIANASSGAPQAQYTQTNAQANAITYTSGSVTGIDRTGTLCTSHWTGRVNQILAYSETEWTSNPCQFEMQDQSYCKNDFTHNVRTTQSGIVEGTNIWDRASCDDVQELIVAAQERDRNDGSTSWRPWRCYWPTSSC